MEGMTTKTTMNNNGRPKSREPRQAISETLRQRRERLEGKISGFRRRSEALREGKTPREPVDELVDLLKLSASITEEAILFEEERISEIRADLYATRARAYKLGDRIKQADISDLQRLVTAGLLDDEVVRAEARRRGGQVMKSRRRLRRRHRRGASLRTSRMRTSCRSG